MFAADVLPCERKRYFALWNAHLGFSARKIAQMGGATSSTVRKIIHQYHAGGLDALKERVHPGPSSRITSDIAAAITAEITRDEQVWDSVSVQTWLWEHHGVHIQRTALREQLKNMGLTWQRTRYVVAGQADSDEKADFADTLDVLKRGHSST